MQVAYMFRLHCTEDNPGPLLFRGLYGRATDAKMVQEDGKPKDQCRTLLPVSDTNMD